MPLLGAAICVAALALHAYALVHPSLVGDDFQIVVRSWTWRAVWDNFWVPANEHVMPLGRLTTGIGVALAGRAEHLPWIFAWYGPVALLLGLPLVHLFVRRELGHPFYGLVAMAIFGVSSVYQQAVFWFSASFSVPSFDMALLTLLAAQDWRRTGRPWQLALSAFWAALAPAWFAIGILAGPLACLYLLPQDERGAAAWRGRALAAVPVLGTVGFLALSLPRTAEQILHLGHYEGETAIEAFHLSTGLLYTCRSLVDNLLLGIFGVGTGQGVASPLPFVFAVLAVVVVVAGWWWRTAPQRRLALLGLGFVVPTYLLVYGARATWPWDTQPWMHTWTRYHLFPQLGLSLFVCAGLPRWEGRLWQLDPAGVLSRRQARGIGLLVVVLLAIQLPRGILGARAWHIESDDQLEALRELDEVDGRCRRLRIDRDTALRALPRVEVPSSWGRENGWELLRCSVDALPMTVEEARRLLDWSADDSDAR